MPQPGNFDEDTGSPTHGPGIANVASNAIDATYDANEQAVLSDLRTKVNAILAALRSAGIIEQD